MKERSMTKEDSRRRRILFSAGQQAIAGYRFSALSQKGAYLSLRVEAEHQIRGVKRCQILVQKFRERVEHFVDDVMETACGLHNFRLIYRRAKFNESLAMA
jgi:hypothetical protein